MGRTLLVLAIALVLAACAFQVQGIDPGTDPAAAPPKPGDPSPTPQSPVLDDLGAAQPAPDLAGPIEIGAACDNKHPCIGGAQCLSGSSGKGPGDDFPGGYCTLPCASNASVCPPGSTCGNLEDNQYYCVLSCTTSATCRSGYECCAKAGANACLPKSECQ